MLSYQLRGNPNQNINLHTALLPFDDESVTRYPTTLERLSMTFYGQLTFHFVTFLSYCEINPLEK